MSYSIKTKSKDKRDLKNYYRQLGGTITYELNPIANAQSTSIKKCFFLLFYGVDCN